MSAEPTLEELLEVQAHFGLPSPALVEKDFYVVRALTAITAIEMEGLRLVFGGGTALSRAHRLVRRMSEDIDLRIVVDNNRSARGALRRLRTKVMEALLGAGFKFDPADRAYRRTQNATRYTIYRLPYEPVTTGEGAFARPSRSKRPRGRCAARHRAAGDLIRGRGPAAAAGGHKHGLRVDPRDGGG